MTADTNNDGVIDAYDNIDSEHLDAVLANCDYDGDN